MEHKTFNAEIKALDEDKGIVTAYIAAFNNVDHQGDKIVPGAFAKSLQDRPSIPMLSQHEAHGLANQVVIGKWTKGVEDDHGLLMTGRVALKTQAGREHFELMKEGMLNHFSIGYTVPSGGAEYTTLEGKSVRLLKGVNVHEGSVVIFPANDDATLVDVKADFTDEERRQLAKEGAAMPDGSYPIRNREDLHNAIQSFGRAKDPDAVRAHIVKRARALGAEDMLPDGWKSAEMSLEQALDAAADILIKWTATLTETKAGRRNSAADQSRIQLLHDMADQMHDHATALGASCPDADAYVESNESPSEGMSMSHRYLPMTAKQAAEVVARIVVARI